MVLVVHMDDTGNAYKILVSKSEGKTLFWKYRWVRGLILELAYKKLGPMVGYCKHGKEYSQEGHFLTNCATVSFS
jgi:hypothetical protein